MSKSARSAFLLVFAVFAATAYGAESAATETGGLLSIPHKLMQGGWTVAVQLAMSIFAGCYAVERFMRLRRDRIAPIGMAEQADRLWQEGRYQEILTLCERQPSILGRIIRFTVTHRGNPFADVSRAASDIGGREIRRQIQKAYPLAVVGMLEPLLGLLGTVIGMMDTFAAVAQAGALGDASVLAHGISKFLVCTGTGLFIAVPCLLLYHYYKLRSTALAYVLEEEVDHLLHSWFLVREADADRAPANEPVRATARGALA